MLLGRLNRLMTRLMTTRNTGNVAMEVCLHYFHVNYTYVIQDL